MLRRWVAAAACLSLLFSGAGAISATSVDAGQSGNSFSALGKKRTLQTERTASRAHRGGLVTSAPPTSESLATAVTQPSAPPTASSATPSTRSAPLSPGAPVAPAPAAPTADAAAAPAALVPAASVPSRLSLLSWRPFSDASPFNVPVPASPALDPKSGAVVAALSTGKGAAVANLYEFGVPIWDANSSTKRYAVKCTENWGRCGLEAGLVPIPHGAQPTRVEDDGAMVVIDWASRQSFEFYDAQQTSSGWTATWGGAVSLDQLGTNGAATGSNVSRLAGVVRTYEMEAGVIDHALVFSTNNACRGVYRFPATKTDGASGRADCIPEGARVQLDPTLDVDAIPGITAGERIVARALQKYGAYAIDNGGANMAFIFEKPSGEPDPYRGVGFEYDYFGFDRIPWSKLRLLRQWDGS